MHFGNDFLSIVLSSQICGDYYGLCAAHPPRPNIPPANISVRQILKMAQGHLLLSKEPGPGTTFRIVDIPNGASFTLIIQGRASVETSFLVRFENAETRGTFATLCNAAMAYGNEPLPKPPYPRPEFRSIEELLEIFEHLSALFRELTRLLERRTGELR